MSSGNIVKLDIGGTVFKTSESTLRNFDGMFKTMLETGVPVKKDESGFIFIDRNPLHFRLILNYMRDGDVELPDSAKKLKEIQKEAQYYSLVGLVELCTPNIPAEIEISNPIPVIRSRAEYLQIIANPTKPVLVIKCPVFPKGSFSYPTGFRVNNFFEKYKHHFDIYFKEVDYRDIAWWWYLRYKRLHAIEGSRCGIRSFTEAIEIDIEKFFWKLRNLP